MLFVQIETNRKGVLVMEAELLKRFEQCGSYLEQLRVMCSLLKSRGIDAVSIKNGRGISTDYYIGEDAVLAIIKRSDGEEFPVVVDRTFFERYLRDGKGSLSVNSRNSKGKNYKIWYCSRKEQVELHRLVMRDAGYVLENVLVDHRYHVPFINTSEALRLCTARQNAWNRDSLSYKRNKKARLDLEKVKAHGEFAYNPLEDYTYTWYAYMIYKMTGDITADSLRDYNRDFIHRYEPAKAEYYKSLLTS